METYLGFFRENVTIFIPTHNRHKKLAQLFEYINQIVDDITIVVLDSSDHCFQEENIPKNVVYNHKICSFGEKFKYIEKIETKYTLLIPDDDQPALNSLAKILKDYDDENREFSSIVGLTLDYHNSNSYYVHKPYALKYYLDKNFSDSPRRIRQCLQYYTQSIWTLHNTNSLKKIIPFMKIFWKPPITCFERCWRVFFEIQGEVIFTNQLMSFRSRCEKREIPIIPYNIAYPSLDFKNEIENSINLLSDLAKNLGLQSEKTCVVREAFDLHYQFFTDRSSFIRRNIKRILVRLLPVATINQNIKIKDYDLSFNNLQYKKLIPVTEKTFILDLENHRKFIKPQ